MHKVFSCNGAGNGRKATNVMYSKRLAVILSYGPTLILVFALIILVNPIRVFSKDVEVNERLEISFISSKRYANPQTELILWIEFTHESGYKERIRGFWDGELSWKVRFKPHLEGAWEWRSECSDSDNAPLHRQSNRFMVVPNISKRPLNQRVKISTDQRTFTYQDGSPFFWLGDTAWEISWKSTKEQALAYLDDRQKKGFTVLQIVVKSHQFFNRDGVVNQNGQPYLIDGSLDQLNPRYFDYLDLMVEEANKRGMIVALVPMWAAMMELHHNPKYLERTFSSAQSIQVAQYIGARYAGDDVFWIVAGDNDYSSKASKEHWTAFAQALDQASGGWHLMTTHPRGFAASFDYYDATATWLDFHMYQSSHLAGGDYTWQAARKGRQLRPVKPVLNGEPNYEDIYHNLWEPGDTVRVNSFRIQPVHVRQAAWESLFSGANAGITYGGNGVWQWHTPQHPGTHAPRKFVDDAWKMPGSEHMRQVKSIAYDLEWYSWEPIPNWVVAKDSPEVIPAVVGNKGFIAYVPVQTKNLEVDLKAISGTLYFQWINPTTGQRSKLSRIARNKKPTYVFSSPELKEDWLLHVFNEQQYGISKQALDAIPATYSVSPAYPNPFNPTTRLRFELPESDLLRITMHSVDGRRVRALEHRYYDSGIHDLVIDARGLVSGVYLIRFTTSNYVFSTKATLLK